MKAIRDIQNRLFIFPDNTIIYDKYFPPGYYKIRFSQQLGFYLEVSNEFDSNIGKIYGSNNNKINKIINRYLSFKRNLGVIFSGQKGLGKSLTAKKLCIELCKKEYPIIIIDENIYGITKFIQKLSGEFIILLEEFEKLFPEKSSFDDRGNLPNIEFQEDFLTIFDNMEIDHKLFILTCNKLRHLSEFYLNRPGRFYYNMQFKYPTQDEILEYLQDNIKEEYKSQIEDILSFSKKVLLNYDSLRAIAFEINYGLNFKDAIKDLNILKSSTNMDFVLEAEFYSPEHHITIYAESNYDLTINLFKKDIITTSVCISSSAYSDQKLGDIVFDTKKIKFINNMYLIEPSDIKFTKSNSAIYEQFPDLKIKRITLTRIGQDSDDSVYVHYDV